MTANAPDEGFYAKKQLGSASRLIAWSHRRRFETILRLASQLRHRQVLDFGCGDGSSLAMLMRQPDAPLKAVGAELTADIVEEDRRRLGGTPGLSFVLESDLERPEHRHAYDLVVCMDVLEHVVDVPSVLDRFRELVTPDGHIVISVPVETGLPLIVKQTVRTIAGWRGIGDYPGTSPYSWSELFAGLTAGAAPHVARVTHRAPNGAVFHDHKGFNWKLLRRQLAARFTIASITASPLPWLPPALASQVWFTCRPA